MARTSNAHVFLRTFAALSLAAGLPWATACDPDPVDDAGDDGSLEEGDSEGDGDGGSDSGDDLTACERNPQGDTYAVGLSKEGELMKIAFVDADPAPPAKGMNTWDIMLTDLEDVPLTGANLRVSPFMPAHNHGSPTAVEIAEGEMAGEYVLNMVDLFMAGVWEVTIAVEMDESTEDSVVFAFCIDP